MKVWHWIAIGVTAFVAFIGLIVGGIFYATSGVTDRADAFFAATRSGDFESAHGMLAQRIRNQETVESTANYLMQNQIDKVVETSWSNRSIQNDRGEVTGTVTTESGAAIPLGIMFIYEGDEWKIDGFDIQAPALTRGGPPAPARSAKPQPTGDPEALAIVENETLQSHFWLNSAWNDGSYFIFASKWKNRPSPQTLASRYPADGLSDEEIELLDNMGETVETAEFDEQGRLIVGYRRDLPNRTVRTVFTYEQVPEAENPWQIVDLEVDLGGA